MGLAKNKAATPKDLGTIITTNPPETVQPESGATAAIARLKTKPAVTEKPQYKQRDFDAEARGKTRCVQFEAALMSPAIAGMAFKDMDEYLVLVKQAADAGVRYTFGE